MPPPPHQPSYSPNTSDDEGAAAPPGWLRCWSKSKGRFFWFPAESNTHFWGQPAGSAHGGGGPYASPGGRTPFAFET